MRTPKPWHLALLVGLGIILAAVSWRGFDPEVIPGYSDYWDYLQLGRQIAEGRGFTSRFTYPIFYLASGTGDAAGGFPLLWRPPLYPLVVAGGLVLTGGAVWTPIVIGIVAYLAAILATYFLALEFTGRRWALLSGLVVALSPAMLGLDEPGLATTLYAALLALAVRAVLHAQTRVRAIVAGLAFGLLTLLRGEALFVLPAMIWLLWAGERGDRERRIWAFLAAAIAITLPWTVRNFLVTGHPWFGTSSLLYIDTASYPGWTSSRMTDIGQRSAFGWAFGHLGEVGWKGLKNLYHFLVQALLLPLAALAPFVWTAMGRLTGVGRESAYCASVLIALGLTIALLAPLEYAARFLNPFIPLLTVVGVIILGRMREQIGEGEGARYTRRPITWVAAAVVTLAALQFLGALRDARAMRAAWEAEFGAMKGTDWRAVTAALPPNRLFEADYPAYYAWKTGRRFLWWRAGCDGPAPPSAGRFPNDPGAERAGLLMRNRGVDRPDPMGIEPTPAIVPHATSAHEIGNVVWLLLRPCPT
ncbi:MAG TPA: glycosyltransferase family 39 protein [Candidatus Eisenbacteria bacterium]